MSQNINKNEIKVLWFGDLINLSGFGRIGNEVTKRLATRGWALVGASIPYNGWPPHNLPFHVWGMGGQDIWNKVTALAGQVQPNVIVCCQDYPYAQTLFHGCRIDWSVTKLIIVTPIDGTPIHPDWIAMSRDFADATMVISKFGVEGLRQQGVHVDLLQPGVDLDEFRPAEQEERIQLRAKMSIDKNAFVIGSFMMNQGRKMVSATCEAFKEFSKDKPDTLLYLDMEKLSPAGWDIPNLLRQIGLDESKVKYREDAFAAGLTDLRDRYVICDISSQMSHREGFGLPNIESQACKVPPTVIDWCSGPEIAGDKKGIIVARLDYLENGTWGGSCDAFPNMKNWVAMWNLVYNDREEITIRALKGYKWVKKLTWDKAADQFEAVLTRVVEQQQKERKAHEPTEPILPIAGLSDTRGIANTEYHSTLLQQPGESLSVLGNFDQHGKPKQNGNTNAGRREHGIQSIENAAAAGNKA